MIERPARSPKPLGPVTEDVAQRHADWDTQVADMSDYAEAALRGDAVNVPDTIYSGLQEAGWYSADPKIDNDPKIAAKAEHLFQLVKEFSVSPSGKWEMTLTDREINSIQDAHEWCTNCGTKQSLISPDEWEERMTKLESVIGPRPSDAKHGTRCPVCGDRLGIHGIVQSEKLTGPEAFTPEQRGLVEEFFQGIYTTDEKLEDECPPQPN